MTTKTYVYRHFDEKGVLLYVGIAADVAKRTAAHKRQSPWAASIARITTKPYKTRLLAAIAELRAIGSERPVYNVLPGTEKRATVEATEMLSVRVPKELINKLRAKCRKTGLSVSDAVRFALEKETAK